MVNTVQKTVEVPQIEPVEVTVIETLEKIVDVPVVKQIEVPQVQTIEKIVEIPLVQTVEKVVEVIMGEDHPVQMMPPQVVGTMAPPMQAAPVTIPQAR
eukprot:g29721.t1